ncbi:MAG TPA: Mur ligase family protein, partial [Acidimicrobiales bacterium]|nr:Mur ligase family protein [Acidimicrobiales bacterium]
MRLDGLIAEAGLHERGLVVDVIGDTSVEVSAVAMDSHSVGPGAMFACVVGQTSDGHQFAPQAVESGARSLLCEHRLDLPVPQVIVTSVRRALGPVADGFNGHPSRALKVVGVTGTNGKTTTCALVSSVFEAFGWRSTSIGTLTQQRTTPEAPELQALMAGWRDSGGHALAMEVSSHALDQHRTDATLFTAGIFTNLTPEHLDYHHSMEDYFEAKASMFEPGRVGVALVNQGDPWGRMLIERLHGRGLRHVGYSIEDTTRVELRPGGSRFLWDGQEIALR